LVIKKCLGRDFVLLNSIFYKEFDTIDNLWKSRVTNFYFNNSITDLEVAHEIWMVLCRIE
jgi:hypothetical protein